VLIVAITIVASGLSPEIASADSPDPKPPQVSVDFLFPPSPLIQAGKPRLVYEMRVTNYAPLTYTLDAIEVHAGGKTFNYAGATLRQMTRFLGEKARSAATLKFDPGQSAIVFFTLGFDQSADVPQELLHTLHFISPDKTNHALMPSPLAVGQNAAVVVHPPLRGEAWIAGDSTHNAPDADHRRTVLLLDGRPWLAQRYAIDWVQYRMVGGEATTWSGPEDKNASYFCYDAPIYSVANGTVVAAMDGLPENVPHSGKYAIDLNFINAGGNHVIVDIGDQHYVFYAHMRPGSVAVKVGDHLTTGQILGHVGNTGSSTEPHLHMHIVDHPSFLAGHGIPYEFDQFSASGPPEMIPKPNDVMAFRNFGPLTPARDDYPANNAAVTFP
jgi:hypothetical protein